MSNEDADRRKAVRNALYTFQERTSAVSMEHRLRFYEMLALNLTIAVRVVWSDDRLSATQKVEIMKWLNEAMHRVLIHSHGIREGNGFTTEQDMAQTLQGYIQINPAAAWYIAHAVYDSMTNLTIILRNP